MSRVIKLTNKNFAESYHKHLTDEKIAATLETQEKEFVITHEIAASCCHPSSVETTFTRQEVYNLIDSVYRSVYQETKYLAESIDKLYSAFYNHAGEGHLPKIQGADKMQKILEKLNLDGDYQVFKPFIMANDTRGNKVAVVDFIAKK